MPARPKTEILAPAGTYQALIAAVRCGADAVYLGGKQFNARQNAENFGFDELCQCVKYCHSRGVNVHLALNTLLTDDEIDNALLSSIEQACVADVDALIVQDLGVARLAKIAAPDMPLHASTQMTVHTLAGAEQAAEMGFSRVVLARELSLKEIEEIASHSPIETEVFVHGALCMCVSGQCLLSSMLGGRSANRGLCAQPCRLPFAVSGGTGHDLSLKDLSAEDYLAKLAEAGVTSFKIEGRMKRPEYVAAAVTACRKALNGEDDSEIREKLKNVFSRSGFTDGYLTEKLGRDMFGIRRKEDVTAAQGVLKELSRLYEKEAPSSPVRMTFYARPGDYPLLDVSCNDKSVRVCGSEKASEAINKPLTCERITSQLSKCGGTQFYAEDIKCEIGDNISLPVSSLNEMRRAALENLDEKLSERPQKVFSSVTVTKPRKTERSKRLFIRCENLLQANAVGMGADLVILPADTNFAGLDFPAAVEIPRVFFGREKELAKKMEAIHTSGIDTAFVSTLDGLKAAKDAGFTVYFSLGSNITNSQSLLEAEKYGAEGALLSPELTLIQAKKVQGNIPAGLILYGRIPLMITRNCPVKNGMTCAQCGRKQALTDRLGISFPVRCAQGYSMVLNSRPLYMLDRYRETDFADFSMLYFTIESPQECKETVKSFFDRSPPAGEYTRGLYYRGTQ